HTGLKFGGGGGLSVVGSTGSRAEATGEASAKTVSKVRKNSLKFLALFIILLPILERPSPRVRSLGANGDLCKWHGGKSDPRSLRALCSKPINGQPNSLHSN